MFLALHRRPLPETVRISFLTGFLFFLGLTHWLYHVTWPGMFLLVFYLSLYVVLFGMGVAFLSDRGFLLGILTLPSLWVALEFLRSHLLTGFGWGLLGYSQWRFLPFIQIADVTGAYGVSFLVMLGNVTLYHLIRWDHSKKGRLFLVIGMAVIFFSTLFYGKIRLQTLLSPSTLRVSVIQGNIPQDLKWDASARDLVMKKYEHLTELAALNTPDIIFWPETSVPGFLPDEKDLLDRLVALSQKIKTYLLVGTPWNEGGVTYNSALFLKGGKILERYDKLHLVPYGEFIPFEDTFPFMRDWIVTGDFYPGKEETVFRHPKGSFSVLVCFEDIFPELVRRFQGSDFLVNITNDAWFGESGAPFQHAQASVFRAVENRKTVLRIANTGYTCLIDPKGRILQDLRVEGEALFVTGFRTWDVSFSQSKEETFYSRYGDLLLWFWWVTVLLTVVLFRGIISIPKSRRM